MIRPFTVICFLLACASGLYLYQTKHRVQMLDRDIERTVHMAEATRDQTRLLSAEWMLLNDPERLRTLADQFLALQTVKPTQFTTLADLDHRLPPVRSPDAPLEKVPEPDVMTPMVPMAQAAPAAAPAEAPAPPVAAVAQASVTPAPAVPAPRPAPPPQVAERKPVERPVSPPAPPQRVVTALASPHPRFDATPTTPRPTPVPVPHYGAPPVTPVAAPVVAAAQGGSALGMARENLPPPRPLGVFTQPLDH